MGNAISGLATFSVATGIIGIVSFLFTLLTALRVFWQNLRTIANANSEVRILLPNLKQALYEERALLRTTRRRCRSQYDEGAFRVLAESIRVMLAEFRDLEQPFVEFPDGARVRGGRRGSGSPGARELGRLRAEREKVREAVRENGGGGGRVRWGRTRSRSRSEEGRTGEGSAREWADDYQNVHFGARSLVLRIMWLHRRSRALDLSERLTRVQSRRIARQTTDIAVDTRFVAREVFDLQERIEALERRLPR